MPRIKNQNYLKFIKEGVIETIEENHIKQALENIKGKKERQGKALLILLYYTGARPVEALDLTGEDLKKQGSYLIVKIRGAKRGLPRPIHLPLRLPLIKELYLFSKDLPPASYLFYSFRGSYERRKDGKVIAIERSDRLRYHFNKWFKGVIDNSIPPYYLRHNRFSKLSMAGASDREIMLMKGSKDIKSINYYIHMSSHSFKKIGNKIN